MAFTQTFADADCTSGGKSKTSDNNHSGFDHTRDKTGSYRTATSCSSTDSGTSYIVCDTAASAGATA
jgi:hypothetical protein